ncbi:MAG: 50S ribosomal protein L10, partial [Bartonella sp.]|nr:50S ribosomal protein L10 [Bartonella sp.]
MLSKVTNGFVLNKSVKWRETVNRAEKREFVTWLNEAFRKSGSVVVAHYSGLTVSQM